jgi:3'-phosphoadenosine 5'-phosphosulfate (PAPS) 3'-phosphatase
MKMMTLKRKYLMTTSGRRVVQCTANSQKEVNSSTDKSLINHKDEAVSECKCNLLKFLTPDNKVVEIVTFINTKDTIKSSI